MEIDLWLYFLHQLAKRGSKSMAYSLLRATSRIFDIAVSWIGIAVFVGAIGGLFQQKSICSALSKKEQINRLNANDRILKRQKICYCVIIGILIILATVKFFGFLNFEDVFNGEYKYIGQTLNNKAEGYGKQFTNDGILMYDWEWVDGSESGSGEFVVYDSDGNIIKRYRGSFSMANIMVKEFLNLQILPHIIMESWFIMVDSQMERLRKMECITILMVHH